MSIDGKFQIAINEIALDGKLPQGDPRWANFNDSFLNLWRTVPDLCNDIYEGRAYTSWHDGRRKADNFILAQAIALDFDTQDLRSSIDVLSRHRMATEFQCIIHTTPTHDPALPKARAIFPLADPITTARGYQVAIRALHTQFPYADKAPTNPASFFYGNKSATVNDIWMSDGKPLPLDALRTLAKMMQQAKPAPVKMQTKFATTELTDVAGALRKINPYSIDYNRWIGFIAAIKREFGDAGFGLAVQWGQGQPGEVEREWRRVKDETSGQPMTVATIFQLAKGH